MAITPEVMEYINSHIEKVISEAREIIGTVVNKDVNIEFQGAEEFDFGDLSSIYSGEVVDVTFGLKDDPEGKFHVLITKETAALVGSLMMMMEEEDPEFNEEEHLDAMKETINQILGSISTNLKEDIGAELGFENIDGAVLELTEEHFAIPDMVTGKMQISIGETDAKPVTSVFTSSTIELIQGGLQAGDEAAEEEAGETAEEEDDATGTQEITAEELAGLEAEVGTDNFELDDVLVEDSPAAGEAPDVFPPAESQAHHAPNADDQKYAILHDLTFPISIELGRTKMLIKDILDLGHGSVIEFDKLAGDPVDLLISDKKIAEGEVVVIDEHFGIRITSMIQQGDFLKEFKG